MTGASETPSAEDLSCDLSVVEREQRLSRSRLWDLQRRYFEREGVAAWSTNTVPHYVTNNPALAHAYARVALGFARDLGPGVPLTFVELGGGSGRFAFLFLRAFLRLCRGSALADLRVRYVLTDFTAKNVAFWREHEAFRPLVAEGVLDFAVFDAEQESELHLLEAGTTLGPRSPGHPLVVIANYVFDGIRQDAFAFAGGELQECLVTLQARAGTDLDDPDHLGGLDVQYTVRGAPLDYYQDPALDGLLRDYAARLDGSTILFPFHAMRCLDRLAALSEDGRLLLLSSDKGDAHEESLHGAGHPVMALHGSFSMLVNYHALGAYTERRGGQALKPPHQHTHLSVSAFLLGDHPAGYPETRLAYTEAVAHLGPDDVFSLRRALDPHYGDLPLEALTALIRLCHDDPRVLRDCLPALWERLGDASPVARRDLTALIRRVYENYYHLGEERDLPFELALLCHGLSEPALALALFLDSRRLYGDDTRTQWNIGLCHAALGTVDEAARCFAAATAAGFTPVGALQAK